MNMVVIMMVTMIVTLTVMSMMMMVMMITMIVTVMVMLMMVTCRDFQGYADKEATKKKVMKDVWRKGDMAFR